MSGGVEGHSLVQASWPSTPPDSTSWLIAQVPPHGGLPCVQAGERSGVTESEVHELIGMLKYEYPDFPTRDAPLWVNSLALADAEAAFEATRLWCMHHTVWPLIAELEEVVRRMTKGISTGKERMWQGYLAECRRQGREPTFEWLIPEAV